jgi:hypothetical protein
MPIVLEILAFKADIPIKRQIEKPPKFMYFLSCPAHSL